jgi:plasmid stability protein
MDKTIRNLDKRAYRALKARAAAEGKTLGQAVSEAILAYLARPASGSATLADLAPQDLGPGTETLSDDVDAVVYGR